LGCSTCNSRKVRHQQCITTMMRPARFQNIDQRCPAAGFPGYIPLVVHSKMQQASDQRPAGLAAAG
jgi:hypothetical protein